MALQFRLADERSLEDFVEMMEQFYAIDGYQFDKERACQNANYFIQNEQLGRLFILEFEGVIIGYLVLAFFFSFEFGGKTAFLDELFIKQEYRNRGFGTKAISVAFSEAQKLGAKAVHLEVEPHNSPAIRLYESFGFKQHKRWLMTKKT